MKGWGSRTLQARPGLGYKPAHLDLLNCDLVVCEAGAIFSLPRGCFASQPLSSSLTQPGSHVATSGFT